MPLKHRKEEVLNQYQNEERAVYNISLLNNISQKGLAEFGLSYEFVEDPMDSMAILLRSQDINNMEFPKGLLAIGRAGAGVNNIPVDRCSMEGIAVFNTPGANANAVKELVLAGMLLAARNIPDALVWTKGLKTSVSAQVEKGKKMFAGSELRGKVLGVLGLGAIGIEVSNMATALGMDVMGFDPYLSLESAHKLNADLKIAKNILQLLDNSDFITIHIPFMDSTQEMIGADFFSRMKKDAVLLNFSRDKVIKEDDLLNALEEGEFAIYVCDFPTEKTIGNNKIILLPHLGASTHEAEENCARMVSRQVKDFIENGNITNSVNFPNVSLGEIGDENRIAIMTYGVENPVSLALSMFRGLDISSIAGDTKGHFGYVLISTTTDIASVPNHPGILRVRVIQDI